MPFAETWVDLEIIILSEASQREKDKYVFIFMWTLKKMTRINLFTKQKQTHIENKLTVSETRKEG